METFLLYALIAGSLYYFLGYARLTDWARSLAPEVVTRWLWCPFCAGFWYGAAAAIVIGRSQDLAFLGLPGRLWGTPLVVGLVTMITTPMVASLAFLGHQAINRVANDAGPVPEADPGESRSA